MKVSLLARAALCATVLLFASAAAIAAKKDKPVDEYPNATRTDPKPSISSGDQSSLNKAADLVNDGKSAEAEPLIQKVLSNKKASSYAQAFAHQLQAQVNWDRDQGEQAIAEYKAAIALDALPNSAQFQVLAALAQTQLQEEKYDDAIATIDQWEKLTGTQTGDKLAWKANAYYRTDRYQEAIDTMYRALSEYVIEGVKTTIPFHLQLMQDERFRSGDFNTKFIEGFHLK
jgi:tetratricopeptide (TPR) repeat protein